jgi:hypothetical protein
MLVKGAAILAVVIVDVDLIVDPKLTTPVGQGSGFSALAPARRYNGSPTMPGRSASKRL